MFGLNKYFDKYINNKFFFDMFCLINTILIFIFYAIDRQYVVYYIFVAATLSLFITNQVRYIVPFIFMFTMSISASITNLPLTIFFLGLFLLSVIIYFIYNKPKIKIKSHGIIIILLSISTFIPIFWYESVELLHDIYIVTYFFYFVIFLVYLFLKSSKEKLLPAVVIAISYIPLLLMLELVFYYLTVPNTNFQGGIFLGWAGGNHASMMIMFSFPFVMYRLYKDKNKLISIILLTSSITAILFGFSRAGYIFFLFELIVFIIYSIYHYRNNKVINNTIVLLKNNYKILLISLITLMCLSIVLIMQIENIADIVHKIFNDNGRFDVYFKGINLFTENVRNFILGRGLVSGDILYEGVFLLYHNTFIQAIVTGGVIMLILFLIHYYQKYIFFKNKKGLLITIILFSFIITDLYGLTDSTYFTSYFTVVLISLLVCFEDEQTLFEEIDNNIMLF